MAIIDWIIVVSVSAFVIFVAYRTRKHTTSVDHFLAADRCAQRYLLAISEGVSHGGAVAAVALFEFYYMAGFVAIWWSILTWIVVLFLSSTGWVAYRYRETRALTLAHFIEMRYSKNLRVFMGLISFLSGILTFSIFPAVGARLFIYFCGLPDHFVFMGINFSTLVVVMAVLLGISVLFVLWGGLIAVIVTDGLQGIICNIGFAVLIMFLLYKVDWSHLSTFLLSSKPGESFINPFDSQKIQSFNVWFFMISCFGLAYNWMSWQATQGYNASAKTAHEAQMGKVLAQFRGIPQWVFFLVAAVCARAVMENAEFGAVAANVNAGLNNISSSSLKLQMTAPMVLSQILPTGLKGFFALIIVAGFFTTHDTCLHSWSSIFIQDIVLPFRKKPISPKQNIVLIRWAIIGVALFVFIVSIYVKPSQHIMLFWAVVGSIFMGGAGSVILGGLYWKRGTTTAAYWSMIVGAVLAMTGLVLNQMNEHFFIDGQWFYLISMVGAISVYVAISLLSKEPDFNLDKMLHRGQYRINSDHQVLSEDKRAIRGFGKYFGIDREFTKTDKLLVYIGVGYTFAWTVLFVIGMAAGFIFNLQTPVWLDFWHILINIFSVLCLIIVAWFTIGGLRDMRSLWRDIKTKPQIKQEVKTGESKL